MTFSASCCYCSFHRFFLAMCSGSRLLALFQNFSTSYFLHFSSLSMPNSLNSFELLVKYTALMTIFASLARTHSSYLRIDLEARVQTEEAFSVISLVNEMYMILRALRYALQTVPQRLQS